MFARPSPAAMRWARAMPLGAKSKPTKRLPGSDAAIGTRFAPSPHATSSTRHDAGGAGIHAEQRRDRRHPVRVAVRLGRPT